MRLSKTSLRKLFKYFDLFDFLHLYIAIQLQDNTLIYPTRFLDSVPNNTALSIHVYDSDMGTLQHEFYSINSFLHHYSPLYKKRFCLTIKNRAYDGL